MNWKATIHYLDQPLSCFLESYIDTNGRRCCRFVDDVSRHYTYLEEEIQANSQPIGESGAPSVELAYSLTHSQPLDSDNLPLSVQSPPQPLASGYSPLS